MKESNKSNWLMWVLLIFLPPFGILYMWIAKKELSQEKKKRLSIIFAVWFIFCMIFGRNNTSNNHSATDNIQQGDNIQQEDNISIKDNQQNEDTSNDNEQSESSTELETLQQNTVQDSERESNSEMSKPENIEESIRSAIEDTIGVDNLETFNYVPDNNFSLIKFKGSENLSNNMTIKGMYLDIFNILKAIQPIIDTDVDFNVVYPLQDKYGNAEDEIVMKATFTNKTIQKINFDNVLWENTPDLADEWWNHDAVNLTD